MKKFPKTKSKQFWQNVKKYNTNIQLKCLLKNSGEPIISKINSLSVISYLIYKKPLRPFRPLALKNGKKILKQIFIDIHSSL